MNTREKMAAALQFYANSNYDSMVRDGGRIARYTMKEADPLTEQWHKPQRVEMSYEGREDELPALGDELIGDIEQLDGTVIRMDLYVVCVDELRVVAERSEPVYKAGCVVSGYGVHDSGIITFSEGDS